MTEIISPEKINNAYLDQERNLSNILKHKSISGYKAAVSGKQAQKNLGLTNLISGVLYSEGQLKNNSTITLADFKLAKIETEIGYILNSNISEKTTSESIKSKVAGILPVYEIPDITANDPTTVTMLDIIANNGFSSHYLIGESLNVNDVDPNTIVAKLYLNGELVNTGNGLDAMDNQWEALSEALNLSLDHGYSPQKGNLIITGALGNILVMEKGEYIADYGVLGKLKLTVK